MILRNIANCWLCKPVAAQLNTDYNYVMVAVRQVGGAVQDARNDKPEIQTNPGELETFVLQMTGMRICGTDHTWLLIGSGT